MIDVQNQEDNRKIKIQQTGVTKVFLPVLISDAEKVQQVLSEIKFTVSLSEKIRGTHMSRLMEILQENISAPLKVFELKKILQDALEKLETDFSAIDLKFKFFVEKFSPVSEKKSLLDIDCEIGGELFANSKLNLSLTLNVPFTSLCPCSKEISDFGAHNQRSICKVKLNFADAEKLSDFGIEKIVRLIEAQGSSQIYPLLKREDEKFVTEAAYQNPKFVEDILRDVVIALRSLKNISAFEVECENFESIHSHNAFASHFEKIF